MQGAPCFLTEVMVDANLCDGQPIMYLHRLEEQVTAARVQTYKVGARVQAYKVSALAHLHQHVCQHYCHCYVQLYNNTTSATPPLYFLKRVWAAACMLRWPSGSTAQVNSGHHLR